MSETAFYLPTGQQQKIIPQSNGKSQLDQLLRREQLPQLNPQYYWGFHNYVYLQKKLSASDDAIKDAVNMDGNIAHGNPVFRGTRIPIYEIVEELADGTTLPEIAEGYPSLTRLQIQRGLDFAASLLRLYDEQIPD